MLTALELVKNKKTKESFETVDPFNMELAQQLRKFNILTRIRNIIGIAPPLVTTKKEVDELIDGLDRALGETEKKFSIK